MRCEGARAMRVVVSRRASLADILLEWDGRGCDCRPSPTRLRSQVLAHFKITMTVHRFRDLARALDASSSSSFFFFPGRSDSYETPTSRSKNQWCDPGDGFATHQGMCGPDGNGGSRLSGAGERSR